ncbi:MAG TPA: NTP transferase domain-containing protein [Oculatellaceae cyanobacterium]
MSTCAIIPAAGRGSRLGMPIPKILVPIAKEKTIWTILYELFSPHVDQIHVVLAESAVKEFQAQLPPGKKKKTTMSVQPTPLGMGDAIFGAYEYWSKCSQITVVWGDQVNLSEPTVGSVVRACKSERTLTLPLTLTENPYVQYDLVDNRLIGVRQTREGDMTDTVGLSDVGLFGLSVPELLPAWQDYLKQGAMGVSTGEINFLPFLTYLSSVRSWQIEKLMVADAAEARGVNTLEDLEFAKARHTIRIP